MFFHLKKKPPMINFVYSFSLLFVAMYFQFPVGHLLLNILQALQTEHIQNQTTCHPKLHLAHLLPVVTLVFAWGHFLINAIYDFLVLILSSPISKRNSYSICATTDYQ